MSDCRIRFGIRARHQHRQLHIGLAGEIECHLLVAEETVRRVIERSLAAFAAEHTVLIPELSELATVLPQPGDKGA
jgi:hypothetical protein